MNITVVLWFNYSKLFLLFLIFIIKALSSLSEEEVINQVLRSDREKLRTQVKELEQVTSNQTFF